MTTITVCKSDSYGACQEMLPLVVNQARHKGLRVKIIDVDQCGKPRNIQHVPRIKVDGIEVSASKLEKMLKQVFANSVFLLAHLTAYSA